MIDKTPDHETPIELINKVSRETNPNKFVEVFNAIKNANVLRSILSEWNDALEEKLKKLFYARSICNDELLWLIWENNFIQAGMTLNKIYAIVTWTPRIRKKQDLRGKQERWWLTHAMIRAISWEYLAHPQMTVNKIYLLCLLNNPTFIREYGAQAVAEMSLDDLGKAIRLFKKEHNQ